MIAAYRIFTTFIYPFLFFFLLFRLILGKEDMKRFREKIFVSHFNIKKKANTKLILFHAASIGEFKSIIPIIEKINSNQKNIEFLITTTTLSSSKIAERMLKRYDNIHHRFLPFDIKYLIENFLRLWGPHRIFLVDSEIWPNLILCAKKYKIPIGIINARITIKSSRKWLLIKETAKKIFSTFELCLCSNKETRNFLVSLSAKNVEFKGNIKLIEKIDPYKIKNINEKMLSKLRFWVAASIHEKEDLSCLRTHLNLKKKFSQISTILIPRHIERAKKIEKLSKSFGFETQILKEGEKIIENKEVIIIKSYGILQDYYKYAKSVFIGKSFIKDLKFDGGQNPIDAAKLNCKIYHGPYVSNFREIYDTLQTYKISSVVDDYKELSQNLIEDLEISKKESYTSNLMQNLKKNIEIETMKLINKFLAV